VGFKMGPRPPGREVVAEPPTKPYSAQGDRCQALAALFEEFGEGVAPGEVGVDAEAASRSKTSLGQRG
jgi:hypothetical protein